jgi:quinol monooxygenase YgiN
MSVKIVAFLTPKAGREAELEAAIRPAVAGARTEPGNLRYDAWRNPKDGSFVIDELYVDHAAIDAHRVAPHFIAFREAMGDLLDGPPSINILESVDVIA